MSTGKKRITRPFGVEIEWDIKINVAIPISTGKALHL